MGGDPSAAPAGSGVVLVLGAGSIGTSGGLRLGHFAAMRWTDPDQATEARDDKADDDAMGEDGEEARGRRSATCGLPEVFIGGEELVRGPADVLGTLLHEAAHALAHVRAKHRVSWRLGCHASAVCRARV